jgi:hypothetical protein
VAEIRAPAAFLLRPLPSRRAPAKKGRAGARSARNGAAMKIVMNGVECEAIECPVTMVNEAWNEYMLPDGSRLRVKLVLVKALRIMTAAGEQVQNSFGEPLYRVITETVVSWGEPGGRQCAS